MILDHWLSDSDRRKLKYLEKTWPGATWSTTNWRLQWPPFKWTEWLAD